MMFILLAEIAGYRAPAKTAENPATRPVRAMLGVSWATGRLGTLKVVSNTDVKSRASPKPPSIPAIVPRAPIRSPSARKILKIWLRELTTDGILPILYVISHTD